MPHVVLLGDSIFDNGAYTSGGPDVVTQGARMSALATLMMQFEVQYIATVEACLRHGLPLSVCTIYNGRFAVAAFQRVATVFVALFDDVILRTAAGRRSPVPWRR